MRAGALGSDVVLHVEKGERSFAAGDRVMFGRNERSMGVKNGSLGQIESVTATRMAVMLDDGRAVAFDLKDYAAVDHGYAATIHKSQGVTVDRVHVLATPGLDRHAAYVALSRHRDGVQLYYGQDDFADQGKLVRALSRERSKDMASDYARDASNTRTTNERGIVVPAPRRVPEQTRARSRFDGLRLRTVTPEPTPKASVPNAELALPAAVERHGRIVSELKFAQRVGEPYTDEQKTELVASRRSLDNIRPHAVDDLETAMAHDNRLIDESAKGRTAATIRAMQLEAEMRENPTLRADVFVQRWQSLERQRQALRRYNEDSEIRIVETKMIGMAKSLERDPQVESILRIRKGELGLPAIPNRSVGQSLADMIGRGRSRGLEIGM